MKPAFALFLFFSFLCLITLLPITGWAKSITSVSLGNETDRLALLAFKSQITQDPQQILNSWNTSHHFCNWEGVSCGHQHKRVVKLGLNSHGLVGSLSPHIGNLSFLRTLNLENNSFNGEIPSQVSHLFRLHEFKLSNNSFSGEIPINLSHCSNLITISIAYNNLSGMVPKELGSLPKLVKLLLHFNNLTGTIPPSLGNLSSLEFFHLSANNLYGSIPDSLGQIKTLQALALAGNMLFSKIPPSLYNISFLQFFSVTNNQISGRLPLNIGLTLCNLRILLIGGNQFSGPIPFSLFNNMSKLQSLDMDGNYLTGKVPTINKILKDLQWVNLGSNRLGTGHADDLKFLSSLISNCSNLQHLDVDSNQLGGILHSSMANISSTQLIELYLGNNRISGNIPSGIENLVNLIAFAIHGNLFTGSIPTSIGKLRNLQALSVGDNMLSGQIPSALSNLSQLFLLNLSYNSFEGDVPSISNCQSLQWLDLTRNNFKGTIKHVFDLLSQLVYIYISNNSFSGPLPLEVGNLENVIILDVSSNKMTGEIPSILGKCVSLEQLSLMGNSFQGPVPPSFSSLKGLQVLDLSLNNLSGHIPMFLQNLPSLKELDLSFNNFEGEVPMEGVFQNASAFFIHGNKNLCGGISELRLPPCPKQKFKKSSSLKVPLGLILSVIVLVIVVYLSLCWMMRRPRKGTTTTQGFLEDNRYERVSFYELHKATDGFAPANLIGTGRFGSVFKGVIREGEEPVAVKVLNLIEGSASKSFITECKTLQKVRHRNLLKILTACSTVDFQGNDFKAIIFKWMSNGSLENWLHPSSEERHDLSGSSLNFSQRLNIAIDIASALDYLHNHCETPIVHCDLKPSNVLLDEDMVAHVCDFGLSKFLPSHKNDSIGKETTSSIFLRGTIGYIPPEYGMGVEASTQGDMYSFGILLLEMITGKRPTNDMFKEGLDLHHFSVRALSEQAMTIVDPTLLIEDVTEATTINYEIQRDMSDTVQEGLTSIVTVGVACSMESPSGRMEIKDALKELLLIKKIVS